jgi:hypothetical protein
LAARNDKPALFDHLMFLGAVDKVTNTNGLTAIAMAARLEVWGNLSQLQGVPG